MFFEYINNNNNNNKNDLQIIRNSYKVTNKSKNSYLTHKLNYSNERGGTISFKNILHG